MPGILTDAAALFTRLKLPAARPPGLTSGARQFSFRVPSAFVDLMTPGNHRDPLLLQVLPNNSDLQSAPNESSDPVGDLASERTPGLLQKYQGRALLLTTGACPIHCRYCFRQQFPYQDSALTPDRLAGVVTALRGDRSIREVILSGGDPLSLADRRLADVIGELASISHLKTLRIHTRYPVVDPRRVTSNLVDILRGWPRRRVIVIHCNHASELGVQAREALAMLAATPAVLLNQSVLLAGVNDSVEALADLSEKLFDSGVLPYYLHMLDPVEGTARFRVDSQRARDLMAELRARLPGYLVPRLVREQPGAIAKLPL
jgi:EF-P beta-lysylation protein EpmB